MGYNGLRFVPGFGKTTAWHLQACFIHCLFEEHSILSNLDRFSLGADHFHAALIEHARVSQRNRKVERRLAPHCGKKGIRPFATNDRGN